MENVIHRFYGKDIYGLICRYDKIKQIILFDASELLQQFMPTSSTLAELRHHLDENFMANMLTFDNQDRLITIPHFLCFILPRIQKYTNLHQVEYPILMDYVTTTTPYLTKYTLERTWYDAYEPSDIEDASRSLFEAGILPRAPLHDFLPSELLGTSETYYPPLYYKPIVLKRHFQDDTTTFNKLTPYILLLDYLKQSTLPKKVCGRAIKAKVREMYLKPGCFNHYLRLDEIVKGRKDVCDIFDEFCNDEYMPIDAYMIRAEWITLSAHPDEI